MSMFDGICGKVAPGLCRLSMDGGIAIKTRAGYRTYDAKKKRMTKDELLAAEDYLYNLARIYGAKTADGEIIADKGYFVTVVYKFGEDKVLGGAYYVKIEGDGWKVLPHDMEG